MPPAPQVTVVVPTRGGAKRLPILLESLANQDFDDLWELVVVVDGDIDGSHHVLEGFADRLPLRVIARESSSGVAAALSVGYAAARGAIVIRCDDDLTPRRDFLSRHLAWHRARPAGAPALGVIALTRDRFDESPYAAVYGRPSNERALAAAYARPADERWMHWAACNSVPKAAYDRVGGFDTTMSYREDSELGYRLFQSGVEIVIDPALEIEHRGPAPDARSRVSRAFTSGASVREFLGRHPGSMLRPPPPHGLWGWLVSKSARLLTTPEIVTRLGGGIDNVLQWFPRPLRGKLVALAVEASAEAGHRWGSAEWTRDNPPAPPRPRGFRRPPRNADVGIFAPGIDAGGGAEKTILHMATTFANASRSVLIFTTGPVQATALEERFDLDLSRVEFILLPDGPLQGSAPQAAQDILRDWRHARAIRKTNLQFFINAKYKSEIPGLGQSNLFYVHFPHNLELEVRSRSHAAYLRAISLLRRAILHPKAKTFTSTYDIFRANSNFSSQHTRERWKVECETLYPPCEVNQNESAIEREKLILNVGRFQGVAPNVPHKNQHTMIEAFRKSQSLINNGWRLSLVGALTDEPLDRAYIDSLHRQVTNLPVDIEANVTRERLAELSARATFYWHAQGFGTDAQEHPEAQEHFGISTVDAMAAGMIPLVYGTAGPLEIVSPLSDDLTWRTIDELVEKTEWMSSNADLSSLKTSSAARARDFSHEAFSSRLVALAPGPPQRVT